MERQYISRCPACGSDHIEKLLTAIDYTATGETFEVWECKSCGMRFTQNAPIEQDAARYYQSPDYISHSDTRKGLVNKVYHYVRAIMLRRKARLVKRATGLSEGNLLDIGAGTGYFANEMKHCGFYVNAIEPDRGARETAARNFGIVEQEPAALSKFGDGSFDVVTMWHVMEHVYRLPEEWQTIRRLLKDKGVLIVAVPNCISADAAHYKEKWAAYDVPRHLWHFSPYTMRLVAQQHGFCLEEIHPMPFDGFYVSMLSEKNSGAALPFLRGCLRGLSCYLRALCDKRYSSSLIYVFRKP